MEKPEVRNRMSDVRDRLNSLRFFLAEFSQAEGGRQNRGMMDEGKARGQKSEIGSRNGQKFRGQRSEDGGQKTESRGQGIEIRGR